MEKSPYIELAECLLPEELVEHFEVVKVEKTTQTLDVTLGERDKGVEGYVPGRLCPTAFTQQVRSEAQDDVPRQESPTGRYWHR